MGIQMSHLISHSSPPLSLPNHYPTLPQQHHYMMTLSYFPFHLLFSMISPPTPQLRILRSTLLYTSNLQMMIRICLYLIITFLITLTLPFIIKPTPLPMITPTTLDLVYLYASLQPPIPQLRLAQQWPQIQIFCLLHPILQNHLRKLAFLTSFLSSLVVRLMLHGLRERGITGREMKGTS